jgi:2-hydroxychromene-2-carboxylate isomerase
MSHKTLELHFDFASPTTDRAYDRVPRIAQDTGATLPWHPMLPGGMFEAMGNASPASVPAKGRWLNDGIARWTGRWNVPFTFNPHVPINLRALMRGACGQPMRRPAGSRRELDAVCDATGVAPRGDAGELALVPTQAGLDAAAITALAADPEVKADLVARTAAPLARGAFGAPTSFVDPPTFFGRDRLDFARDALAAA